MIKWIGIIILVLIVGLFIVAIGVYINDMIKGEDYKVDAIMLNRHYSASTTYIRSGDILIPSTTHYYKVTVYIKDFNGKTKENRYF